MSQSAAHDLGFIHVFEAAANPASPTLLLLHGTGGDEQDLLPLGHSLVPGAALLSPRGKVLEGGAARFFRRLAEGVFDQQDLARRTAELAEFLQAAVQTYRLDQDRLIAVGFSNGANIAVSLLLRYPGTLAGAVLFRAMVPFEPDSALDLTMKPILLLAGSSDPIVPPSNTSDLAAIFERAHANVRLTWVPGGHGLSQQDISLAQDWLREFYPQ